MSKKWSAFFGAVFAVSSLLAAQTVAKFDSPTNGDTNDGFTVEAHTSGGGFCVTSDSSWSVAEGVTIVLKYSGLQDSGDQAIATVGHSNDGGYVSKLGIAVHDGRMVGIAEDALWNATGDNINIGSTLSESGTLVFIYDSNSGVFVYDAVDTSFSLYSSGTLKYSNRNIGHHFDFGSTHNGQIALDGFSIDKVMIMQGVVAVDSVSSVVGLFNQTEEPTTELPDGAVLAVGGPHLRISEIMPKPTDKSVSSLYPATLQRMDPNGLESGWVELENTSDAWVNLADYKFTRTNRSKKTSTGYGNFPTLYIPPRSRFVFWTSERYSNSADMTVSAFVTADADGVQPKYYAEYDMLIWPDKVNPKKSPFVRLSYAPDGGTETIIDTVVVPSDIPEGHSIIVDPVAEGAATTRWMTSVPTRGTANTETDLIALGPNAGPLYEIKGSKKHDSANEFARNAPPAIPGEDYTITFSMNPTMHPTEVAKFRSEDEITSINIIYRTDLDDATLKTNAVDVAAKTTDAKDWGDTFTATIPSSDFPEAGHLIQWKFEVTDASGNTWITPSFHNKDDGYEWYGTIVEPTANQMSATLPTWHLFADAASEQQMDVDVDKQNLSVVPYNARVAIYDSTTSNYYDYVRIDLRGNTSARFSKKSHGLRFAKAHPLTMKDVVSGEDIEEIRKTSLISEYADPSLMRQMIAFWLWNKMGNKVPFDFPVRCNLNGEFYQLAFNSERFTDELIEDVYGFDKFGYGYKNVGTLKSGSGTSAGGIEKKTPDDGNESDITVLQNELRAKIKAAQNVTNDRTGANMTGLDNPELTKFVVEKFDMSAWLNYLASAKITQEMDDVWANISIYYDNAEMKEGVRGTGTWIPLGYDFNLSFGQYYYEDTDTANWPRSGLMSTNDWFKSHPFFGGNRVRCYKSPSSSDTVNYGNDGFEAVWQSAKFRRLYLRRLRTLMDQELGSPNEDETFETSTVPFIVKMREMLELMHDDAEKDFERWPNDSSDYKIDVWASGTRPTSIEDGVREIYNHYLVPRRQHLYVTHSVTNTERAVGYGTDLNAGIPEAQSATAVLKAGVTAEYDDNLCAIIIRNTNNETIDVSGWKLSGPVTMTMPSGTVLDLGTVKTPGEVYITADRRATIAALGDDITDQVIVGNGVAGKATSSIILRDANGELVTMPEIAPCEAAVEVVAASANEAVSSVMLKAEVPEEVSKVVSINPNDYAEYFMLEASAVAGDKTRFMVATVLNPEVVLSPEFGETDSQAEPIKVESEDETGKTIVSIGVVNAKVGLWYGFEASDYLTTGYQNDVESFELATSSDEKLVLIGSPREGASGFFRVKVLPVCPQE